MYARMKLSGWVAVAGLLAVGCGPSEDEMRQLAELPVVTTEKERLQDEVEWLTGEMRQIESQLAGLSNAVAFTSDATGRSSVPAAVGALVARLNATEEQLAAADRRLRSVNATTAAQVQQIAEFEAVIAGERAAIEGHRQTIASLEASVSSLRGETTRLNAQNQQLEQTVQRMTNEANAVWYTVGTKQELLDRGVIREEGGSRLLFIFGKRGKTLVLAPAADATSFTAGDLRTLSQIPLPAGDGEAKWQVVTPQDLSAVGSPLDQNGRVLGDALRITEPQRFWARSHYLILVQS